MASSPRANHWGDAITEVDKSTKSYPSYFMINCAHPSHFSDALAEDEHWTKRIRGIRANASRLSHAELDEAEDLDTGDPEELGTDYSELKKKLPKLNILGGCCGTDQRHIEAIARHCATYFSE